PTRRSSDLHGFRRNALELEGHHVGIVGQLAQLLAIVIGCAEMLAQGGGAGVRCRVEKGELLTQRRTRQSQHASELTTTDDADFHDCFLKPDVGPDYPARYRSAGYGNPARPDDIADGGHQEYLLTAALR